MNRVIPKYVPANSLEDKFGFLVTALDPEGKRQYLARGGYEWAGIGEAEFFDDPLNAADSIKAQKEAAEQGESSVELESIKLVKVTAFLVPTEISPGDLKRRRRAAALAKLTEDEIEALGLGHGKADDKRPANGRAASHG